MSIQERKWKIRINNFYFMRRNFQPIELLFEDYTDEPVRMPFVYQITK